MEDLLEKYKKTDSYRVSDDYFELLPDQVLDRIKAEDLAMDEWMSRYQKTDSYEPEADFMAQLPDQVMMRIQAEDAAVAAALGKYAKTHSYDVPEKYFDSLPDQVLAKISEEDAKRTLFVRRRRIAMFSAAASCALIVGIGLFVGLHQPEMQMSGENIAKTETVQTKKVQSAVEVVAPAPTAQLLAQADIQPEVKKAVKSHRAQVSAKEEVDHDIVAIGDFEDSDLNSIDDELLDMYSDDYAMWSCYDL